METRKILVAPLDWGLGHATRMIPVIRELLSRHCDVFLAGSGESLTLLKREFPTLHFFMLPAYDPAYPTTGSIVPKLFGQVPKFFRVIRKEHQRIEALVSEHNIDLVISDNRYGCWSTRVPSVFVTHQYNVRLPNGYKWLEGVARMVHRAMIKKFAVCWIPDIPGEESLAGELSYAKDGILPGRLPGSSHFLGILSRFEVKQPQGIKYDIMCLLSGPEPQRTIFERLLVEQLKTSHLRYFLVRGCVESRGSLPLPNCVDFLPTDKLQDIISQSSYVLARSGYSTVMDLAKLGKKAIFIPTPGQPEQEYIAELLMKKNIAYTTAQRSFNLPAAWKNSQAFSGFQISQGLHAALKNAIDQLLSGLPAG